MTINVNINNNTSDKLLKRILKKLDLIMTKQEKFDAALERLNTTTNDIAADLQLLKDQIANGTVTDESIAKLDANVATLEALGASTENPVPDPVEPEPTEPTEPGTDNENPTRSTTTRRG